MENIDQHGDTRKSLGAVRLDATLFYLAGRVPCVSMYTSTIASAIALDVDHL